MPGSKPPPTCWWARAAAYRPYIRVDVLVGQLGVTRGSFYWHFRDREDLLRRVLQAWSERPTAQLTQRLESARSDPRDQLRDVMSLPLRGRSALRAARIAHDVRYRNDPAPPRFLQAPMILDSAIDRYPALGYTA